MTGLSIPELPVGISRLDAAYLYADAGWYIVPVDPDTKDAGSVLHEGWPEKSSRNARDLERWFGRCNWGLALHVGRSGGIAFDVDQPGLLPDLLHKVLLEHAGPFQKSRKSDPRRGHYIYLQPEGQMLGNGKGTLVGEWGEVRGKNGVIVVEPTPHSKAAVGGCYEWQRWGEVPETPAEVVQALQERRRRGRAPRSGKAGATSASPVAPRITGELDELYLLTADSVLASRTGKQMRDAAGVTVAQMAQQLGVQRARASHLETGRLSNPSTALRVKYGKFLLSLPGVSQRG